MEPWQSWAAAVCIGGAAFWYYAKDSKYFMKPRDARSASISDQTPSQSSRRRNDKQSTKRKDESSKSANAPQSYAEVAAAGNSNAPNVSKKRKAGRAPGARSNPAPNSAITTTANNDEAQDNEASYEDKEWAKQLDASRRGVVIGSSKSENQQRTKTKHQNESLARPDSQEQTQDSNGSDAAASKGDVSDMLESPSAAPSVLRVTGIQEPKKAHVTKAETPQETKKQRQNRRKAEEKKLQREEDEKQRQVLLNDQRRSAREARGEPAKNGVMSSNPPAKNAWSASARAGGQPNGSSQSAAPVMITSEAPLLDTFEQDGLSTASSNEVYTNATTPATVASAMDQDLPSEEAQLEMLNKLNENVGWSEVGSKGKKGKKKQSATTTESATPLSSAPSNGRDNNPYSAISTGDLADDKEQPNPPSALKTSERTNGVSAFQSSAANTPWIKGHPDDSDWAVY